MTDLLEDIEPVRPKFPVVLSLTDDDRVTLDQLAVLLKVAPNDVLLELLHRNAPSPNGHGYEVLCSGCRGPVLGLRTDISVQPPPDPRQEALV